MASSKSHSSDPDYDTETMSLNSTVPSEHDEDEDFVIDCILSEKLHDDDVDDGTAAMLYLIKWEGYGLHRCTWEPEKHLQETDVLPAWVRQKSKMSSQSFRMMKTKNEAMVQEAQSKFERLKATRQEKRAKKRKNFEGHKQGVTGNDSSGDDGPVIARRRSIPARKKTPEAALAHGQDVYNSLFVDSRDPSPFGPPLALVQSNHKAAAKISSRDRLPPLHQSTDDEATSSSGSSHDSADSPMDELTAKVKKRTNSASRGTQEHNLGNSILSRNNSRIRGVKSGAEPTKIWSATGTQAQGQCPPLTTTRSKPISAKITTSNSLGSNLTERRARDAITHATTPVSAKATSIPEPKSFQTTSGVGSTQNLTKSTASIDSMQSPLPRTAAVSAHSGTATKATTNAIRMINQKGKPSTRSQWDTRGRLYKKLRYRELGNKRSRIEGTPDINALEFVGAGPPIIAKPRPSNPDDNPYSRRETGNRRVQDVEEDMGPAACLGGDDGGPLQDWEAAKVPMACPHWISGNCLKLSQHCKFLHRRTDSQGRTLKIADFSGIVPPKYRKPPVTCWFYQCDKNGCDKPDKACKYAHYNTGFITAGKSDPFVQKLDPEEIPLRVRLRAQGLKINEASQQTRVSGQSHMSMDNEHPQNRRNRDLLTCFFWKNGNQCRYTAETCSHQHRDTGVTANAPFWWNTAKSDESIFSDVRVNPNKSTVQDPSHAKSELTRSPIAVSLLTRVNDELDTFSLSPAAVPAGLSCHQTEETIGRALGVNFNDLFTWSDDGEQKKLLDRRAFLMFNPVDHQEELELITRWLLMHHVEVSGAHFAGAWEQYADMFVKDRARSGIVIVHPDFEYFSELKNFGKVLRNNMRIWSLGMQGSKDYDAVASLLPPDKRQECVELFPAGGLIHITDDIFELRPRQALRIIKLFIAKLENLRGGQDGQGPWEEKDNVNLLWRLCVRPELMEYIYTRCEEQEKALKAGDADVLARAELYTLLSDTEYIEQDSPAVALSLRPDKFPIISERRIVASEEPVDYFNSLARSREKANLRMVRYYAGLHIDVRCDYRYLYVVHTDCSGSAAKQWQRECENITDIITPERCIDELSKGDTGDEEGKLFDFYDRYLVQTGDDSASAQPLKQVSLSSAETCSA
ncbi:hypothetical protein ACEQ8H_000577 [Pleosporales sp. CAS-2024a]